MCLLLNVPEDITCNLLTQWLFSHDVPLLDSAHCCGTLRTAFLLILGRSTLKCRHTLQDKPTRYVSELFEWALKKGVGLQVLSIPAKEHHREESRYGLLNMIRNVEHLKLSDTESLQLTADFSERLFELRIGGPRVENVEFSRILPTIEKLVLSGCLHSFLHTLRSMMSALPNLSHVDLHGSCLRNVDVKTILNHCPKLRHLDCSYCPNVTAAAFASCNPCPALSHLSMNGSTALILQHEAIQMRIKFPGLTSLYLEYIASDAVPTLVSALPDLLALSISDVTSLSDAAVCAVAVHCPQLQQFFLCGRCGITDRTVETLTRACPGITHLGLSACTKLTVASIKSIADNCAKLQYFSHPSAKAVLTLPVVLLEMAVVM